MRRRTLLGGVIVYDHVWRTGGDCCDAVYCISTCYTRGFASGCGDIYVVDGSAYRGVDMIVNKEAGIWGTDYDARQNLGMVRMESGATAAPVEAFAISIVPADGRHGMLVMEWGNFRWTAGIEVE